MVSGCSLSAYATSSHGSGELPQATEKVLVCFIKQDVGSCVDVEHARVHNTGPHVVPGFVVVFKYRQQVGPGFIVVKVITSGYLPKYAFSTTNQH